MRICNNCLSYPVCHDSKLNKAAHCMHFKDAELYVRLPIKIGTQIDNQIVDGISYRLQSNFDGSILTLERVYLRDVDCVPPMYTADMYTFKEFDKLMENRKNEKMARRSLF